MEGGVTQLWMLMQGDTRGSGLRAQPLMTSFTTAKRWKQSVSVGRLHG